MKVKHMQLGIVIVLLAIGVLGRIYLKQFLPHLPGATMTINGITQPVYIADMFFVVALVAFLSGMLLKGYYAVALPITVMIITDIFYGNNYIFLFTWSGFTLMALLAYAGRKNLMFNTSSIIKFTGIGIGSILVFDLWANFGWWLGPYYPHTIDGLITCYILGIPFMIWHLLSASVLIAAAAPFVLYLKETSWQDNSSPTFIERYTPITSSGILVLASIVSIL